MLLHPPPTPPYQGDATLPRGLSRHLLAFSYLRYPYGEVAHQAASACQRCVRKHQSRRRERSIQIQNNVRAWKARVFTKERRQTYEAALVVLQRQARSYLARVEVAWRRQARRARAAQTIQSLHRGVRGRRFAREWQERSPCVGSQAPALVNMEPQLFAASCQLALDVSCVGPRLNGGIVRTRVCRRIFGHV